MQFSVHKISIIRGRDIAITALSLSSSGMRWVLRPDYPTYILSIHIFPEWTSQWDKKASLETGNNQQVEVNDTQSFDNEHSSFHL